MNIIRVYNAFLFSSFLAAMLLPFDRYQTKALSGYSSHVGIFFTDGEVSIGEKRPSLFKRHVTVLMGMTMASIGLLNLILFPLWQTVFFHDQAEFFSVMLFIVHLAGFDFFIGLLLTLTGTASMLPNETKQFHSLEHKVLNLWKKNKAVNFMNIQKASSVFEGCGVNIMALWTLFTVFLMITPLFFGAIFGYIVGFDPLMATLIFISVLVLLAIELQLAVIGSYLQERWFTKKPTLAQVEYTINLCRHFVKKQHSSNTKKALKKLDEECRFISSSSFSLSS